MRLAAKIFLGFGLPKDAVELGRTIKTKQLSITISSEEKGTTRVYVLSKDDETIWRQELKNVILESVID